MKHSVAIVATVFALTLLTANRQSVHAGSAALSSGATVRGTVKVEGTVPKPKPINMAADPSCAKQHPSPVLTQDVISDGKGDLQNVVVFVSEGLGDRAFDPPSQPVEMKQKGCMYEPHVLALQANQPVDVTNDDPTTHNIHPQPANNREWNKAEIPGSKIEESFPRPEIAIPVKCNVHPWMRGYVAVFKHPYFAVTGKDGSFSLSNLPPGTYTVQAWHEKFGTATQQVTISANESKSIDFVFKSM
ncbi:MAG: carboxypeptidase regulatory-like domain-containing protein [Acidobacteriaceae bacterium]|nr:carboxypeptidase regulatory-like domain-containing protein [Acidobacteriaceae bacterium]